MEERQGDGVEKPPLVVGISGASGVDIAWTLLEIARAQGVPVHLVISEAGARTIAEESRHALGEFRALADAVPSNRDIGAPIASGGFATLGMIVVPCSMRSLAEIAHGLSSTLLTRAADVTLKERRPLVLAVRESPLHLGHLRNMVAATETGAIIAPPVPAFYQLPADLDDLIRQTAARLLSLVGIEVPELRRWPAAAPSQD